MHIDGQAKNFPELTKDSVMRIGSVEVAQLRSEQATFAQNLDKSRASIINAVSLA